MALPDGWKPGCFLDGKVIPKTSSESKAGEEIPWRFLGFNMVITPSTPPPKKKKKDRRPDPHFALSVEHGSLSFSEFVGSVSKDQGNGVLEAVGGQMWLVEDWEMAKWVKKKTLGDHRWLGLFSLLPMGFFGYPTLTPFEKNGFVFKELWKRLRTNDEEQELVPLKTWCDFCSEDTGHFLEESVQQLKSHFGVSGDWTAGFGLKGCCTWVRWFVFGEAFRPSDWLLRTSRCLSTFYMSPFRVISTC